MHELSIKSFEELQQYLLEMNRDRGTVFRGVSKYEYELIPSIGRQKEKYSTELAKTVVWLFRTHAAPHLHRYPQNEWEWLAVGQHHGLPTSLLDWSRNPLVATFFAAQKDDAEDGAIYCCKALNILDPMNGPLPSACTQVCLVMPSHITTRMAAQSGLFTYHPEPNKSYDSTLITKVRIPAAIKAEFRQNLEVYGIHPASLFPDLDGISAYIRWLKGI